MANVAQKEKQYTYLNAEIVEDSRSFESYDDEQIQGRIEQKDSQIELFSSVGKTAILAGGQLAAVQALYQMGIVGVLPGAIAFLPVLGSAGATMTNVRLQGWIPVPEDKNRIVPSVIRTGILAAQATKLTWDAHQRETLASQSFTQIAVKERAALGLKPEQGIGFETILVGVVGILFLLKILRKK